MHRLYGLYGLYGLHGLYGLYGLYGLDDSMGSSCCRWTAATEDRAAVQRDSCSSRAEAPQSTHSCRARRISKQQAPQQQPPHLQAPPSPTCSGLSCCSMWVPCTYRLSMGAEPSSSDSSLSWLLPLLAEAPASMRSISCRCVVRPCVAGAATSTMDMCVEVWEVLLYASLACIQCSPGETSHSEQHPSGSREA